MCMKNIERRKCTYVLISLKGGGRDQVSEGDTWSGGGCKVRSRHGGDDKQLGAVESVCVV